MRNGTDVAGLDRMCLAAFGPVLHGLSKRVLLIADQRHSLWGLFGIQESWMGMRRR